MLDEAGAECTIYVNVKKYVKCGFWVLGFLIPISTVKTNTWSCGDPYKESGPEWCCSQHNWLSTAV